MLALVNRANHAFKRRTPGTIEIDKWAQIVSHELDDEISPHHLTTLKDFLCECESNLGVANYTTMFAKRRRRPGENGSADEKALIEDPMDHTYLEIIDNLFDILDKNGDKRISVSEAQDALARINDKIGQNYSIRDDCVAFVKNMDRNGDNMIDLHEFRRAFFEIDEVTPARVDSNNNQRTKNHRGRHDEDGDVNSDDSEEGDLQIVRI